MAECGGVHLARPLSTGYERSLTCETSRVTELAVWFLVVGKRRNRERQAIGDQSHRLNPLLSVPALLLTLTARQRSCQSLYSGTIVLLSKCMLNRLASFSQIAWFL